MQKSTTVILSNIVHKASLVLSLNGLEMTTMRPPLKWHAALSIYYIINPRS